LNKRYLRAIPENLVSTSRDCTGGSADNGPVPSFKERHPVKPIKAIPAPSRSLIGRGHFQLGGLMTTTVKVSAHCATTKEVKIHVSGELHTTLQDGESIEVLAYDDRVIEVKEILKT
jgi:hypothetical protein